jgi:hypothetical protein
MSTRKPALTPCPCGCHSRVNPLGHLPLRRPMSESMLVAICTGYLLVAVVYCLTA